MHVEKRRGQEQFIRKIWKFSLKKFENVSKLLTQKSQIITSKEGSNQGISTFPK